MKKTMALIPIVAVVCGVLVGLATAQQRTQQATGEIVIVVPGNAEIFFHGHLITEKGTDPVTTCHSYVTPPLGLGNKASYVVLARWQDNGRVIEQTRTVVVRGGASVSVNFLIPLPTQVGQPGEPARNIGG
jgi:uncharacterized protein (TIGR03000 family)